MGCIDLSMTFLLGKSRRSFPSSFVFRYFNFWVSCLVVAVAARAANAAPQLVPLKGLPQNARQCASIAETPNGWVVGTADGVLCLRGDSWVLERVPGCSAVAVVVPWGGGFIAAGSGFSRGFTGSGWRSFPIDDDIYAGDQIDGHAFLSGRRGVYHISPTGETKRVLPATGQVNVYLHVIRGVLYVFTADQGALQWSRAGFIPAVDLAWAQGAIVGSVQECKDGRLFAATTGGMFILDDKKITPVCPRKFPNILSHSLVGAAVFGDHLIAAMYYGGIAGLSISSDELEWRLPPEALGGNTYFTYGYKDGLLIGHSNGISVLHDPERFPTSPLPAGDLLFIADLTDGVRIGLTSGVFTTSGKDILYREKHSADSIFSLAETKERQILTGYYGKIDVGGKTIPLQGREVSAIAVASTGKIAALQPHGVSIGSVDGAWTPLLIDSAVNSLVAFKDDFLVGTAAGVFRVTSAGAVRFKIGSGSGKVFAAGGSSLAIFADGKICDGEGKEIGQMPPGEAIGAVTWGGLYYVLSRLDDGEVWLGVIDDKTKGWWPMDIPLPESARALAVEGDKLLVVAPGILFAVKTAEPLERPTINVKVKHLDGRDYAGIEILDTADSDIILQFPPNRLGGWRTPRYQIRVGLGAWEHVVGGRIEVPRLGLGINRIDIQATWGGMQAVEHIAIQRAYPWFLCWYMMIVYGLSIIAIFVGAVRWRTRHTILREQRLQALVSERTAELRRANLAKEEFLSAMSHEIRNPLNGVVGLCDMLLKLSLFETDRWIVTSLHECAEHLRSLLGNVLDFAIIDRGEVQLDNDAFNPRRVIEGAVRVVDVGMGRCVVDVSGIKGWLHGDAGKIRQIIINLVSNALKYGTPAAAKIEARTETISSGKTCLVVAVSNTGITIPVDEQSRIFEGFKRGRDALGRRIPGAGVGLAVSKRLSEAMGGALTVSSNDGITCFTLRLELCEGAEPVAQDDAVRPSLNSRVLVIEDEGYNRIVLDNMLTELGYTVALAECGADALALAKLSAFDIILTDWMLPDMDGVELMELMLPLLPNKPRVIAVTAYSTPEKIAAARAAGVSGYVVKPLTRSSLEAAISTSSPISQVGKEGRGEEVHYDFSRLLQLPNGKKRVAEYSGDLISAWKRILAQLTDSGNLNDSVANEIHTFNSLLSAARAIAAAKKAGMLERYVRSKDHEQSLKTASELGVFVQEIAHAAQLESETSQYH